MLEFIPSPEDVIALKISGSIKGTDLDPIMDRLDAVMAAHDQVHVFVETQGIEGLELSSLPHYFSRAFPLFGKLRRFGRVAVVADQAWIRVGTRMESAMLPFISYRTFEPGERDEALDWVFKGLETEKA
jgi:stage II sporulation SpoAA-like protein